MAITALNPDLGLPNGGSKFTDKTNDELDNLDFMHLLITQLEHQDPLNPQDGTEFAAQLAQFSSLDQLSQINAGFEALNLAQTALGQVTSISMIGKEITVRDEIVTIQNGEARPIEFDLDASAETIGVTVYDENGTEVAFQQVNNVDAGSHGLEWNGLDRSGQPLPDGTYTFSLGATDSSGNPVGISAKSTFAVDGVEFFNGETFIKANGNLIPLAEVISVTQIVAQDTTPEVTEPETNEPEEENQPEIG